ncbi:DUF4258 domain-containing protein [Streptomyces sp. NPDC056682]|uniref:DUF4258 domain-containing protein n=1 Tax=Streptomyces sp. NPDC056682 TaxID=3345909 RepID=UPI0036813E35
MDKRIATISGTMLTPGVSRNRRLYSPELIAKAAKRMTERIADPDGLPIVMRSHHEAGDDSTRIVGRLTDVKVGEDGAARYRADLYDTAAGRDIAALITGKEPALKSVSIHGYWLGPVKQVKHDGESVMTGDDLEIDALDFTATPGVLGASVTAASYLDGRAPAESMAGRTPISESVEATVEPVTEEAPDEAYTAGQKRDALANGQAMKNAAGDPSYPIKSKSDLRKAIRAVGRGGADQDKIRAHIVARAQALGLSSMIPDNWNKDGSMKENALRLGEIREYYPDGPGGGAGFCIDAYNGPLNITMRACGIDPAELRVITAAAMTAAVDALQSMDPDMDADIDVDGAPHADTDGDSSEAATSPDDNLESAPGGFQSVNEARIDVTGAPLSEDAALRYLVMKQLRLKPSDLEPAAPASNTTTETTPAIPAEETTATTQEVPAVSEPTTPAAETASTPTTPMIALTQEQFTQLLDRITPAREAAPAPAESAAEPPAESAPAAEPVAETDEQRIARLVAEGVTAAKDELREQMLRESGLPQRTGYRVHESEQPAANKEDAADLFKNRAEILLGDFGRTPQPTQ